MKKTLLAVGLLLAACAPSFANPLLDEIVDNSKLQFLKSSQLGYAWILNEETSGPIALLNLYQYRFIVLGAGWTSPFPTNTKGAVVGTAGVHLDKLTRLIAPNASDTVRDIMPKVLRPAWEMLTFSYGPGWNFDTSTLTHLVAINFNFGGSTPE